MSTDVIGSQSNDQEEELMKFTTVKAEPKPFSFSLRDNAEYAAVEDRIRDESAELEVWKQERSKMIEGTTRAQLAERKRSRGEQLWHGNAPPPVEPDLKAELAALNKSIAEREETLEYGRSVLEGLRLSLSEECCKEDLPEYSTILQWKARAASELAAASRAEREFREKRIAAGILFALFIRPMVFLGGALRLDEPESHISMFLRELVEYKYLTPREARELGLIDR
jgi:hypothetical protein